MKMIKKVIRYLRDYYNYIYEFTDDNVILHHKNRKQICSILFSYYNTYRRARYIAWVDDTNSKHMELKIGLLDKDKIDLVDDPYIKLCIITEICKKIG